MYLRGKPLGLKAGEKPFRATEEKAMKKNYSVLEIRKKLSKSANEKIEMVKQTESGFEVELKEGFEFALEGGRWLLVSTLAELKKVTKLSNIQEVKSYKQELEEKETCEVYNELNNVRHEMREDMKAYDQTKGTLWLDEICECAEKIEIIKAVLEDKGASFSTKDSLGIIKVNEAHAAREAVRYYENTLTSTAWENARAMLGNYLNSDGVCMITYNVLRDRIEEAREEQKKKEREYSKTYSFTFDENDNCVNWEVVEDTRKPAPIIERVEVMETGEPVEEIEIVEGVQPVEEFEQPFTEAFQNCMNILSVVCFDECGLSEFMGMMSAHEQNRKQHLKQAYKDYELYASLNQKDNIIFNLTKHLKERYAYLCNLNNLIPDLTYQERNHLIKESKRIFEIKDFRT